jgi:nucleotide-binding universal stress UspA family protein
MKSPSNLLIATDFSEGAALAEEAAIALAVKTGARLHWVHALEVPLPLFEPYAVAVPSEFVGAARKSAKEKLQAAAAQAKERGVEGTIQLGEVPAATAIAERAEEVSADCLVLATRGHTGLKHMLLGSVAERAVKLAPCSVLTVKESGSPVEPSNIVVGLDFSEHSGAALDMALDIARGSGATLHLVHALDLSVPFVTPYEISIPDKVIDQAWEAARQRLAEKAQSLEGVEVSPLVASAPASEAICDTAEKVHADLVVTGSRGLTGLKHAILGSVAERVLRHAPCSVLTVRTREA